MTPKLIKKVTIIDPETGEIIRNGTPRAEDSEFRMIKSLFGLSRDTVVKLFFGVIAGAIWYTNDVNFKSTVIQYMARQDTKNLRVDSYIKNSDSFHTAVFKTQFEEGQPRNQGYEQKNDKLPF